MKRFLILIMKNFSTHSENCMIKGLMNVDWI